MELVAAVRASRGEVPVERLLDLEAKVARALRRPKLEATLRCYRSDWEDFSIWCSQLPVEALPATGNLVAACVAELAQPPDDRRPAKVSTITRRLAAIGEAHKLAGETNPATTAIVRETMKGIRRMLGVAPTQKKALSTSDIRAAVTRLPDSLQGHRDRLILLLGFAGGMRRSEVAGLDVEHLEDHADGLLVHLPKSKTDQEQRGRRVEIVYGRHTDTCPVVAWRAWQQASGITSGPVFRPIDRHGNLRPGRLTAQSIAIVVKRHARALGQGPQQFAGHSLRRGMATQTARNGAPERIIMATTGHHSIETIRGYIDDAELFTDPASRYLDL